MFTWQKLTIRTKQPEKAAANVKKSDKVRNVQIHDWGITYEQYGFKHAS